MTLPTNFEHVVRRIRACESEVPAQIVMEHAMRKYAQECVDAALSALRAQPAEPLVFGMRGPKMTFTIGNQSFTLDYEPETTDEYVFMGNMLKAAISKLPLGVKIGAQPDHSEQHLEMVAAARAVVERWDTPLWKDAPATAGFINRLRDALPPAIEGKL